MIGHFLKIRRQPKSIFIVFYIMEDRAVGSASFVAMVFTDTVSVWVSEGNCQPILLFTDHAVVPIFQ
jgi:hypothetical protein